MGARAGEEEGKEREGGARAAGYAEAYDSLAVKQRSRISPSCSCTCLPGRPLRTSSSRSMTSSTWDRSIFFGGSSLLSRPRARLCSREKKQEVEG